ncbi:MFS transporter [Streptomyces sp. NPDC046862]|uniref:MFS transporter n=1 Tax=Streptomyces sp. NPDC046862 TaxID=3154603 RepID=UPI0034526C30
MLAGVVGTVRAITVLCVKLPAGALSDRFDRRLTMIICDITRAVLLALLGILIALDAASWQVVLAVSLIEGAAGAVFDPSAAAALPGIVPDEQLEQAWAASPSRVFMAVFRSPDA